VEINLANAADSRGMTAMEDPAIEFAVWVVALK